MPPKRKSPPPPPPPHGPVVVVPPPPYRRRLEIIDVPQGADAPTTPGKWQLPRVPIAFIALYFIVLVYASDLDLPLSLSLSK